MLLEHLSRLRGGAGDDAIEPLAERLGLDLDRPVHDLSKGNRQKIGVIAAFMHDPEVLILDEPASGLDPLRQHDIGRLIRERADAGRTVLLSSHALDQVEHVADRVGILRDGRMVAVESVEGLKDRAVRRIEIRLDRPGPARAASPRSTESPTSVSTAPLIRATVRGSMDPLIKALAAAARPHADQRGTRAGGDLPLLLRGRRWVLRSSGRPCWSDADRSSGGRSGMTAVVGADRSSSIRRSATRAGSTTTPATSHRRVRALFVGGETDITSGIGYLNSQIYAFVGPLLLLIFAIGIGSALVAGEEESGNLELTLSHPLTRSMLVRQQFGFLVAAVAAVSAVLFLSVLVVLAARRPRDRHGQPARGNDQRRAARPAFRSAGAGDRRGRARPRRGPSRSPAPSRSHRGSSTDSGRPSRPSSHGARSRPSTRRSAHPRSATGPPGAAGRSWSRRPRCWRPSRSPG